MGIIDLISFSYIDATPKNSLIKIFGKIGNKRRSGRSIMKKLGSYDCDTSLGINNNDIRIGV